MTKTPPESVKLLKPVDHIVLGFAEEAALRDAAAALAQAGVDRAAGRPYNPRQMHTPRNPQLEAAGPLASLGQDTNLAEFRRKLAADGHGWLVVHAPDDEQTAQVTDIARRSGARLAQKFTRFTIEELV